MKISFYENGEVIATATSKDHSAIPESFKSVELHKNDEPLASGMMGSRMRARTYTPADGDRYFVALAASYKWGYESVSIDDNSKNLEAPIKKGAKKVSGLLG